MNKVISLNRIALFFILIVPWVFLYLFPFESILAYIISFMLASTVWLIWLFALADAITKRVLPPIRPSNNLFQFNLVILYINAWVVPTLVLIFQPFYYTGLAALPFLIYGIYSVYAFLAVLSHLSKILTYAENKEPVMFKDRLKEMIGFAFFPIGIWWLQPRIQKIIGQQEIQIKGYVPFK